MSISTGQVATASDVNAIGEGYTGINLFNYDSVSVGTWVGTTNSLTLTHYQWSNSTSSNGDTVLYKTWLSTGTYSLNVLGQKANDAGILDIDIDGSEIASIDYYASAAVYNYVFSTATILIATADLKEIKLRVDGKNAKSSDYYVYPCDFALWRTV